MSTIIKFDLKELRRLASDKQSCIVEKKVTQNLAVQPWCLGNVKESIKNKLDYKIGKFEKEFNGILMSYKNLRVIQNVGTIRNDNADIYFQVQADNFIFRPYVGAVLKGIVNKKTNTHLAILVHRVFNVVIPHPTDEPGSKWIGESVQEGQEVIFRIVVQDLFGALPYIRGELDKSCMDMGPDGDDEIDAKSHQINVPYVNFDKTKPCIQKQMGDGLQQAGKTNAKSTLATTQQVKPEQQNGKSKQPKVKSTESELNVSDKMKIKRQSKVLDADRKDSTNMVGKILKKHKKDL